MILRNKIFFFIIGLGLLIGIDPQYKSLLIPGLGEKELGDKKRAQYFYGAELLLWSAALGSISMADQIRNDLNAYASIEADINIDDKDMIFLVNMGNYDSLSDYNDEKRRQRLFNIIYEETDANIWDWSSDNSRYKFDNMRIQQSKYTQIFTFTIAGMIVNRAISFFDTIYLSKTSNKAIRLQSYFLPNNNGIDLSVKILF